VKVLLVFFSFSLFPRPPRAITVPSSFSTAKVSWMAGSPPSLRHDPSMTFFHKTLPGFPSFFLQATRSSSSLFFPWAAGRRCCGCFSFSLPSPPSLFTTGLPPCSLNLIHGVVAFLPLLLPLGRSATGGFFFPFSFRPISAVDVLPSFLFS